MIMSYLTDRVQPGCSTNTSIINYFADQFFPLQILKTPTIPKHQSQRPEIYTQCSPPDTCYGSCVTCHLQQYITMPKEIVTSVNLVCNRKRSRHWTRLNPPDKYFLGQMQDAFAWRKKNCFIAHRSVFMCYSFHYISLHSIVIFVYKTKFLA